MITKNSASGESIHDLHQRVLQALPYRDEMLLNLIDALAVGPRPATPSEVALSPLWGFACSTLYSGLRQGADPSTLTPLRQARLQWWQQWGEALYEPDPGLGPWRVRVLDATNYDRPKTRTVRVGYVHGAEGMKPGHGLSVLSERVAEGSWYLPLEIALIPVEQSPTEFGAEQIVDYVRRYGWQPEEVLAVDAAYTNEPTLRPMVEAGVNVLGRVSSKRVFYLPPPPYSGHGRPRVRGRKIKLNDQRTLPEPNWQQRVEGAGGGWYEISQWVDVRMRKWPTQPLVLYRVWEYRADGTRRYKRPLWLIYVGRVAAPKPSEAQAIYDFRFGIEISQPHCHHKWLDFFSCAASTSLLSSLSVIPARDAAIPLIRPTSARPRSTVGGCSSPGAADGAGAAAPPRLHRPTQSNAEAAAVVGDP